MKQDLRYTPTDIFETFPFPTSPQMSPLLGKIGEAYHTLRQRIMLERKEGLTKTYNRFHDPNDTADDIVELRQLHQRMDAAVAAAYEWRDLAVDEGSGLRHDFHESNQGVRWAIHPGVRSAILDRLLALNHKRHADEVAGGLHDKKGKGRKGTTCPFDDNEELNLDFASTERAPTLKPVSAKEQDVPSSPSRSSAEIETTELLNAIFTCTARRESTDRDDLTKEVATALSFQRLRDKTRELVASGFNSAIRRGIVSYEGQSILRLAETYAELEIDTLVKAINATVRPGCVYTPEEVLHNAADYLGCFRLSEPFRESLESALTAASRRGIITKRGEEIRKIE